MDIPSRLSRDQLDLSARWIFNLDGYSGRKRGCKGERFQNFFLVTSFKVTQNLKV